MHTPFLLRRILYLLFACGWFATGMKAQQLNTDSLWNVVASYKGKDKKTLPLKNDRLTQRIFSCIFFSPHRYITETQKILAEMCESCSVFADRN